MYVAYLETADDKIFYECISTLGPQHNGWHSTDNIFKSIFSTIFFLTLGEIINKSPLFQVMAWHQTGGMWLHEANITMTS